VALNIIHVDVGTHAIDENSVEKNALIDVVKSS
jgi:hypothetical protein